MSITALKRRADALYGKAELANPRSFTLEGLHRMMWRKYKRAYLKMASDGNRDVRVFLSQFETEEAQRAEWAALKSRGSK